jgi:hypothetical protein
MFDCWWKVSPNIDLIASQSRIHAPLCSVDPAWLKWLTNWGNIPSATTHPFVWYKINGRAQVKQPTQDVEVGGYKCGPQSSENSSNSLLPKFQMNSMFLYGEATLPWRWMLYVPPKRLFTQDVQGATSLIFQQFEKIGETAKAIRKKGRRVWGGLTGPCSWFSVWPRNRSGLSLATHRGGPGLVKWDLWWTK